MSSKLGMRVSRCRCPVTSSTQDCGVEERVCPKENTVRMGAIVTWMGADTSPRAQCKSGLSKLGPLDQISPTARFSA